jgi:hypothetical protein
MIPIRKRKKDFNQKKENIPIKKKKIFQLGIELGN